MSDEDRAELIRNHWKAQRGWPTNLDVLRVPVRRAPTSRIGDRMVQATFDQDILEFRREYGRQDGKRAMRTVCEGVVVETTFLD